MVGILTFIVGIALTLAAGVIVVIYLQEGLVRMLSDVCGSDERARFWRDIFNVSAILTPVLIAAGFLPTGVNKTGVFWETVTILKLGLGGVTLTVALLALVMNWHLKIKPKS